jgi:hypothetical protein
MCDHQPPCPSGTEALGVHARMVACHPEQGWYLLCNGVVLFDDGGAMLADHSILQPPAALVAR